MSDQSSFQGQPAYIERTSHKKRWVTIFFVVLLLVIAALGALYLLGSSPKHMNRPTTTPLPTTSVSVTLAPLATSSATVSTTPAVTNTPTNSPSPLQLTVLNGSGTSGVADNLATKLKMAGYTNITTGNAKVFTYTGITIYVKKQANLKQLQQAVASAEPSVKITSAVDDTIAGDGEIIIGK